MLNRDQYRNHPIIKVVMKIARQAHEQVNQTYDGKPYFDEHVMSVFEFALKYIHLIPEQHRIRVLCAVLLHDVLEDCPTVYTYNDLNNTVFKALRGTGMSDEEADELAEDIVDIAFALTNETGKTRSDRANSKYYQKMITTEYAPYAKICDRLANALASRNKGQGMSKVYIKEYKEFKKKLFIDITLAPMFHELDIFLLSDEERAQMEVGSLVYNTENNMVYIAEKINIVADTKTNKFTVTVDCVGAYVETPNRVSRELVTFPIESIEKHW